jgi:hypothetical protein
MATKNDWRERLVSGLEERAERAPARAPLTTSQHILHLLLTIFTVGLWAPVWFVRAWRGNPVSR